MKPYYKTLFSITFLLFISCHKNSQYPINYGYEYFPTTLGHFIIYDVDSISYNDFTDSIDTFHYQVKEILTENFNDISGRASQRIEKHVRLNDTSSWEISQVGYQTLTTYVAEKYEDNLRYIKLSFPVKNNLSWKGNTYINYNDPDCNWLASDWEYKLTSVNELLNINGNHFDLTAKVIVETGNNIICQQYYEEIYAKNVGMIYRKVRRVTVNPDPSGYSLEYKVKSYN